jgi:hypothetical protein
MAYVINRWDGVAITTIEDGTVDTTLDIKLIGKNYAGYGEIQNENFLHMLENFAGATRPTNAIRGQIWYDTTSKKLKFYTGDQLGGEKIWKTAGGVEHRPTEPENPTEGDLWFDTTRSQLKVRASSTSWLTIGPQSAGTGVTQMISRTLKGVDNQQRAVIAATIEDQVVAIMSADNFSIDITDPESQITGYTGEFSKNIKRGITLPYSNSVGVSTQDPPHIFWGTASNALRLDGKTAAEFITAENTVFSSIVRFADPGFTVGTDNDLRVFIENGVNPVIDNTTGPTISFRVRQGSTVRNPIIFNTTSVDPGTDIQFTLGSPDKRWSNVHSQTFTGVATQADSLRVGNDYRVASVSSGANTIAVRDSSGNLTAGVFSGVATSARYADLAEKYLADKDYEAGTVVTIGGEAEIRSSIFGDRALGVISTNPAFMMNKDLENGVYVALKGRVPVKITGSVKKGDRLVASDNGCAVRASFHQYPDVFAIALEDSEDIGVKFLECVIL